MTAFEFGFYLGAGFCIPAAIFSLGVALAVTVWDKASARRQRQRMIREGLYELHDEVVARRQEREP